MCACVRMFVCEYVGTYLCACMSELWRAKSGACLPLEEESTTKQNNIKCDKWSKQEQQQQRSSKWEENLNKTQ